MNEEISEIEFLIFLKRYIVNNKIDFIFPTIKNGYIMERYNKNELKKINKRLRKIPLKIKNNENLYENKCFLKKFKKAYKEISKNYNVNKFFAEFSMENLLLDEELISLYNPVIYKNELNCEFYEFISNINYKDLSNVKIKDVLLVSKYDKFVFGSIKLEEILKKIRKREKIKKFTWFFLLFLYIIDFKEKGVNLWLNF